LLRGRTKRSAAAAVSTATKQTPVTIRQIAMMRPPSVVTFGVP
jgi:hypothetical protein